MVGNVSSSGIQPPASLLFRNEPSGYSDKGRRDEADRSSRCSGGSKARRSRLRKKVLTIVTTSDVASAGLTLALCRTVIACCGLRGRYLCGGREARRRTEKTRRRIRVVVVRSDGGRLPPFFYCSWIAVEDWNVVAIHNL
ncbi:hypothetical protein HPP92_001933 [Vanilla planifolia]|uniref:Uncharacterized protein n=1 Tax=Vanilla planifolia TaxID=51239 RepID=A0A835S0T8_VANPL|nr:hypothetical protein HPP92_001933 [Vanilla planifolia]